jgi:hypothetical protein
MSLPSNIEPLGRCTAHGSLVCASLRGAQLASSDTKVVFASAPSSLPMKSHFLRPTAFDFSDWSIPIAVVVDRVGVGHEEALVASEHVVDRVCILALGELEEGVSPGHDQHPEVSRPTPLFGLHKHARRVRAQVGPLEGVGTHRVDQRLGEPGQRNVPAADRGAGQLDAFAGIDALETVERQVIASRTYFAVRFAVPVFAGSSSNVVLGANARFSHVPSLVF